MHADPFVDPSAHNGADPSAQEGADPSAHDPAQAGPRSFAGVPRYMAASDAKAAPGDAVRGICARVVRVEQCKGARARGGHRLRLRDLAGNEHFETLPLLRQPHLLHQAFDAVKHGYPVIIYGTFPHYDREDPRYDGPEMRLEMHDLRRLTQQTSLLSATAADLAATDALLQTLWAEPDGFLRYAIAAGRRHAGVVDDHLSARYLLGEELAVLQALSFGMVNPNLNSRLSLFLLSGPGTGKDRLAHYVQLFAPLSEQVQPTQLTPAGLGATVTMGRDSWQAHPGVLAKVSLGTVVMDDLHRLDKKIVNGIQGLLMTTIEEARIRPCKAGSATYDARTALFLTSNQRSLREGRAENPARPSTPQERAADLGLPMDLLSRLDIVLHMGTGDDALRSAVKIASQPSYPEHRPEDHEDLPTPEAPSEDSVWQRHIKLLFSRAKDLIPKVDLSAVEEELEDAALSLGVLNRDATAHLRAADESMWDGDGLSRRMASTLRKLVGALARVQGRHHATAEDVQRALTMASLKQEIVRYVAGETDRIRPTPPLPQLLELARLASEERWGRLMAIFAGHVVQLDTVIEALGCSERAARRELTKRGIEPSGTWYQIPTQAAYDAWQAERQDLGLRAELVPPPKDEQPDLPPPEEPKAPPKVWDDGLPVPPESCKRLIEQISQMDLGSQLAVTDTAHEIALHEHPEGFPALLVGITGLLSTWGGEVGVDLAVEDLQLLRGWLLHGAADWTTRGSKALGVLAAAGMTAGRFALKEALERPAGERPEALTAALTAWLARLQWAHEDWMQRLRAQSTYQPPPPPPPPLDWSGPIVT